MERASKMTPLERQQYYRSFGKTKKEGIHTAVIGRQAKNPGLYYDPNLPFIETYQYFRKPSATARAQAKKAGHTLKDEYSETRSRFIQPKEEDSFVMAQTTGTADEGWRHKYVKVRQSEAIWNDKAKKWVLPVSKDSIRNPTRAKRIQEVVNDISDNPEKHGLKLDPTKKIRIAYGDYVNAVNKVLKNEGYKDIPASSIKNAIVAKQGTSIVQLRGTDTEKRLHNFLRTIDPETKRPYYENITATELRKKLPWLKSDNSAINESRRAVGLQRTNIGKSESDKVETRVIEATRKVRQKVKKEHSYLSDDEVDAMMEQARIMLGNLKPGYKKVYPDKTINAVYNFIEDTEILNRGMDPYYNSYIAEKALNRLRTALTGETHTMGHARKEAADTWWFPGYETPTISPQKWDINFKQRGLDAQFQAAIKRGDMGTAMKAYKKMLKMGMRSSMVDEFGEQIFYGAPRQAGKMAGGGLIKKGLQKLLGDSAFSASRRKFMKQASAAAAATAVPKSILKGASTMAQASKLPLPDAVPWVKTMTNMLKGAVDSKKAITKLPNGTEIFYLKKPLNKYDSHKLSIKTADGNEDLVNFKEGKNDFEIEFDIADDFATNQYLEVNKKTGYTEMIDSNLRMAPGGEDVIKDDPIVWAMEKTDVRDRMILDKTTKPDDYMYDYMSVPDDTDYAHLFERYVDSFSPAGNIFKTKELARAEKARELKMKKEAKIRAENREMDWEEQFRGGRGMHGYYRGGTSMRDYKPQIDESRRMIKLRNMSDVEALARMMFAESSPGVGNERDARAIGHVIQNRAKYTGPDSTYGLKGYENYSPIKRVIAGQNQFTPFRSSDNLQFWDFDMTEDHPYYKYAAQILKGEADDFTGGATMFDLDPNKYAQGYNKYWNFNPAQFEHEGPHSFWSISPRMNRGGMAKPYTVDDAVKEIKANPQRFMAGGLVKKLFAPKVVGKLTDFKPKLTGPDLARVRTDLYTPPKGPYTITNEDGVRVLDKTYENLDEAQAALKELAGLRMSDASTFKIFGKRPPRTAEGVNEAAPEVDLGMIGKELPPEKPGAMFWNSREKIIGAPSEAMTGIQWLQYLKMPKHGILNPKFNPIKDMELNDTGLAPHLSKMGKQTVTKEQLVKDFDNKLAPEIDVVALGGDKMQADQIYNKIMKYDMQAYREGPVKNVLNQIRNTSFPLKEAIQNNNQAAVSKIIDAIEGSVFNNTGVANSIREGFPQKFPFELKKILQDIAQVTKTRLAGFDEYAKRTQYKGQQTLSGGENYREFVFKYKHPRGSLRETEPYMTYGQVAEKQGAPEHFTSLADKDTMGGFMHMRVSDRTDEFGRRILHIEEIQSDMHQAMNRKQREIKKIIELGNKPSQSQLAESKYAPRGDLITEPIDKANEEQLGLILSKIDEIQSGPMNKQKQIRLNRLNKERIKIRKIIEDKKAKMAEGDHSGVPQGPFSKTEDYNEFVMKYAVKVAQEGGYDGVSISSAAIKNKGISVGNRDYKGNLIAYGPMAEGAMKKAAKKSGAKFIKTAIMDADGRGWEVPMIWLDDAAKFNVQKGMPIYKRGGMVING